MNAFQDLIRDATPALGGLQDCILGGFAGGAWRQVESTEGIQILHIGHNHWVTILWTLTSPRSVEVNVADSLNHGHIHEHICYLCKDIFKDLTVNFKLLNVTQQTGGIDCGAFACAFGALMSQAIDVEQLSLKQDQLRPWIRQCLSSQRLDVEALGIYLYIFDLLFIVIIQILLLLLLLFIFVL